MKKRFTEDRIIDCNRLSRPLIRDLPCSGVLAAGVVL